MKDAVTNANIRFLGWDALLPVPRSVKPYPPNASPIDWGVGIHHPRGEPMKISHALDPIDLDGSGLAWPWPLNFLPNTHLKACWNLGTVEGGSSGSPLFDQNKRIRGQLHGSTDDCYIRWAWYGALFLSMQGSGTDIQD